MDTDGIIQILAEFAKSENLQFESLENYTGYQQMGDSDLGYYKGFPQMAVSNLGNMASDDTSVTGLTGRSATDGSVRYGRNLIKSLSHSSKLNRASGDTSFTDPTRSASERPVAQCGYGRVVANMGLWTTANGPTETSASEHPVAQCGDVRVFEGTFWRAVSGFGRNLISRTWQQVTSNYAASVKIQLLPVHDILQTLQDPHRERLANRMREILNEYSVVDLNTLTENIMQDSSLVRKIIIKYLVEYLTEEMSLPVRLPIRDDSIQHVETRF